MSTAELERLQTIVREIMPFVEEQVKQIEDSYKYADGRIHDVDVLHQVRKLKKWLARAKEAAS